MNCRRVSNLLSAYLDAELTGAEMLALGAHLDTCPACRAEVASLQQTKRLLGALGVSAPRPGFESLMRSDLSRIAARPAALRWLPSWLLSWPDAMLPRPVMAAAALSLTTVLVATATVYSPSALPERRPARAEFALAPRLAPVYTYVPPVPLAEPTPLVWPATAQTPLVPVGNMNYSRPSPLGLDR